uniref:Expressed protein n=1 Tax=Echinococcus granulosus TaxID=6210 RepID=A0A068WQ50_ECHGR|nr:expressed protein [Echinococcus granulosus]
MMSPKTTIKVSTIKRTESFRWAEAQRPSGGTICRYSSTRTIKRGVKQTIKTL